MSKTDRPKSRKIHWLAVVFPVAGIALAGAAVARGELWLAVAYVAITFGFAAGMILLPGFSDTVVLLGDDAKEERNVYIHRRAAHFTINVVALFIACAGMYELARGGDSGPYALVGGVGAVAYFGCVLVLNWRS